MNATVAHRGRWVWAGVGGALVLAAVVALFRSPPETRPVAAKPPAAPTAVPAVRLVNLGKNEAALTDPTPLFLPTEWNAGQDPLPATARHEPGSAFAGYPAKLKFAETELALNFPADVAVPARASDALASAKPGQLFLGLGDAKSGGLPQLTSRKAFVEIVVAADGRRVLSQPLADAAPPGTAGWQPMEFLVAVDATGLVGPPILTESSRVAAVDGYFQNYLVKTLHAGERLAPGFYRICVGP